jgi:hypothetical protein
MSWFEELAPELQTAHAEFADKSPADVLTAYSDARSKAFTVPDDPAFEAYKEMKPEDLIKQHAELSGKVKDAIVPLGENASEDERKAFDERMRQINQVPEKAEAYQAKLPENVKADDPLLVAFQAEAHKAGMSPTQFQAGVDTFVNFMTQMETQAQAEIGRQREALKIEQGAKFDEYIQASEGAMRELGVEAGFKPEEVQDMITRTGLKDNIMFVRMFNKVSRFFEEGRLKGQPGGGQDKSLKDRFFTGSADIK